MGSGMGVGHGEGVSRETHRGSGVGGATGAERCCIPSVVGCSAAAEWPALTHAFMTRSQFLQSVPLARRPPLDAGSLTQTCWRHLWPPAHAGAGTTQPAQRQLAQPSSVHPSRPQPTMLLGGFAISGDRQKYVILVNQNQNKLVKSVKSDCA